MDKAGVRGVAGSRAKRPPPGAGIESPDSSLEPRLGNDLDYLVRTLRRRQVQVIDALLANVQLPLSAWYPLVVLQSEDGISQRELARRLHLKDAAIGKSIAAMERDGILRRSPDEADHRKILVFLTAKGRRLAAKVTCLRVELLAAMSAGFSARETETFRQLLQRAYRNLGSLLGER